MKVLLDIDDKMALHLMVVLKGLPYVKTHQLTEAKANFLKDLKEAVKEMKDIKAGKKTAQDAEDFLIEESKNQLFQVSYTGFFKKSVNIDYTFGNDSTVNIAIYDKLGNYIETLVESKNNLEPQTIKWRPVIKKKEMYFVVLKTESIYQVKKVVI